jgi:hypothetical protein
MADGVVPRAELRGQGARALARPPERRLRVPARQGLDECFQPVRQLRIARYQRRASATRPSHPPRRQRLVIQFQQPLGDRDPRQATRPTHERHAAMPQGPCFTRRKQSPRPFVEVRPQQGHLLRQCARITHANSLRICIGSVSCLLTTPNLRETSEGSGRRLANSEQDSRSCGFAELWPPDLQTLQPFVSRSLRRTTIEH